MGEPVEKPSHPRRASPGGAGAAHAPRFHRKERGGDRPRPPGRSGCHRRDDGFQSSLPPSLPPGWLLSRASRAALLRHPPLRTAHCLQLLLEIAISPTKGAPRRPSTQPRAAATRQLLIARFTADKLGTRRPSPSKLIFRGEPAKSSKSSNARRLRRFFLKREEGCCCCCFLISEARVIPHRI